jgi:membrane protein
LECIITLRFGACLSAGYSFKKLLSLLIAHLLVDNFYKAEPPLDAEKISHNLEIPIRLVRQILFELVESGIISEVRKDNNKDIAYQPAIDVGKLTIKFVVKSLENRGISNIPVGKMEELSKLSSCLSTFADNTEKSPANILLKDL